MCVNCWEEWDSPKIKNNKVLKARRLIGEVYEFACTGGSLHIVLDDYNISYAFIDSCIEWLNGSDYISHVNDRVGNDGEWYNGKYKSPVEIILYQLKKELECAEFLKTMTLNEIVSAIALYDGYWKLED
jgi:hypothetical protein